MTRSAAARSAARTPRWRLQARVRGAGLNLSRQPSRDGRAAGRAAVNAGRASVAVASSMIEETPPTTPRHGAPRRTQIVEATEEILGQFLGDDAFPVTWASETEQALFWVYDDLHIPHPVSPMFFDIGGWWLSCDHMFRRFGTPFAVDWLAKNVNGYVYTTAIPADPDLRIDGTEYSARYGARVPRDATFAASMGRLPRHRPARVRRALRRLVARPAGARDAAELRLPRGPPRRRRRDVPRRGRRASSRTRSTSTIATGRSTGC